MSKSSFDLFITYAPDTEEWVLDTMLPLLQGYGGSIATERDVPLGANRIEAIASRIASSRYVALVVSDRFVNDKEPIWQAVLAIHHGLSNGNESVIPILVHDVQLPLFADVQVRLDCRDPSRWVRELHRLAGLIWSNTTRDLGAAGTTQTETSFSYPVPQSLVGRDGQLIELGQADRASGIIFIAGLPGVGKTALAARFFQMKFGERKSLWCGREFITSLEAILFRIAEFLDLTNGDRSLIDAIRNPAIGAARKAEIACLSIERHGLFLVIDQHEPAEQSDLADFLVTASTLVSQATIIVTLRELPHTVNWMNVPYVLRLGGLDDSSGAELLRSLMHRLELPELTVGELTEISHVVGGHPHALRQFAALSEVFSVRSTTTVAELAQTEYREYIQQHLMSSLSSEGASLLRRLAHFRQPFESAAVDYVADTPRRHTCFLELVRKMIVSKVRPGQLDYDLHALVKSWCAAHVVEDVRAVHLGCYHYYLSKAPHLANLGEALYHAIEAGQDIEAKGLIEHVIGTFLRRGLFDLVIAYTGIMLQDERTSRWSLVHFLRGRAFRIKNQLSESLACYEQAVECARDDKEADVATFEIASVVTKLQPSTGPSRHDPQRYYERLTQSSDRSIREQSEVYLAFKLAEKTGSVETFAELIDILHLPERPEATRLYAEALALLGTLYAQHDNADLATKFLEQSLEEREKYNSEGAGQDYEAIHYTARVLADVRSDVSDHFGAKQALEICIGIDQALGFTDRLVKNLRRLGSVLCFSGEYDKAAATLREAISEIEKSSTAFDNSSAELAAVCRWLAEADWYLGEHALAIEAIWDHSRLAELGGARPTVHAIIEGPAVEAAEAQQLFHEKGGHLLIIPPPYSMDDLGRWGAEVLSRRPELLPQANAMLFQKRPEGQRKTGRNDHCWCGSGKKFKRCCINLNRPAKID